jgi:hypothetical protein
LGCAFAAARRFGFAAVRRFGFAVAFGFAAVRFGFAAVRCFGFGRELFRAAVRPGLAFAAPVRFGPLERFVVFFFVAIAERAYARTNALSSLPRGSDRF